ncbi:MAG: YncE family protein [Acidobacteria bacterium]|nr:YncE family protein [Acidobacteriota bacterium]MBI3655694.1 YncE family protein [Acidobacteriota bacterium]
MKVYPLHGRGTAPACLMAAALGLLSLALTLTMAAPVSRSALLVLNKADNQMAIIDPATRQIIARLPTGESPHEVTVSADGRLAFISNFGAGAKPGHTLTVIDIELQKVVRTVELGALLRPHGIVERGGKVYFTVEGSRAVARYDPQADRVDWVMGTGQSGTHMLVVTPDQKKLYTTNMGSDTVTIMELSAAAGPGKISHINVGKGPEAIDLSADGRELWVAHRGDGELSIIDTTTDRVKETIKVGRFPIRVKFAADGRRVLVSDAQTGELAIFDAASRKEIKRLPVGTSPVGILIAPDGRRAFIAATESDKVSVIDLESLTVVGTIAPGRGPDGMAWRGK